MSFEFFALCHALLGVIQLSESVAYSRLEVLGPFRLVAADGKRLDVSSKKGQAMVAMLALAGGGERTRSWLQDKLWGSRQQAQAQASLRNELAALRTALNTEGRTLIHADQLRVWLDLSLLHVDAREMGGRAGLSGELLEGLDIAGEEAFEDWLREERARLETLAKRLREAAPQSPVTVSTTTSFEPAQFARLPALAVLPFANLTGDPAQGIFAEGISEDLIDCLSRLRWLPIIARSSSFALGDATIDPKAVGDKLGARYVLEGRLRAESGGFSLATSLSDTDSGQVVWSNRLKLEAGSPSALEELLAGLSSTLGAKIDQQEQSLALRKPQSDLNVRDLIWRGRWHLNRFTKEDSEQARACFAEALEREPNSPEAIIQHAWAKMWDLWANRGSEEEIRAVRKLAQNAIMADLDDARGHMLAGIAECWLRQPVRAEASLRRAIDLNPSLVLAHSELGSVLYLNDRPEEAIEALNCALRLNPNDHSMFYALGEMAMSYLMLGNHAEAILQADRAIMSRSAYWYGHVIKINALVRSGNSQAAKSAFADLRASNARFKERFIDWLPFVDDRWNRFLLDGLNLTSA